MADKDFRAIIKAQLDTSNIPNQIRTQIENQTITFNNINFNRTNLINQIQSALDNHQFNLNFGNMNYNNLVRQMQQLSNQIGTQLRQNLNTAVGNIPLSLDATPLARGLGSLGMGNGAVQNIIRDFDALNITVTKVVSTFRDANGLNLNVRGIDQYGRMVQLLRQYNDQGILVGETTNRVTQNFEQQALQAQRNTKAINDYTDKLNKLHSKYADLNATKPIRDTDHINQLAAGYTNVQATIQAIGGASSQTFTALTGNVDTALHALDLMVTEFQNAEYAASQLRAKPVNVVRDEQLGLLKAFVADIQKAGISLDQFTRVDIAGLETMLRGVTNADGLKQYLNTLSIAKAEFKGLKQEAAQFTSAADVNILISKMETWLNKNTKAASSYGNTVRNLITEYRNLATNGRVLETDTQRIAKAFKEVDANASAAGMKGRSFFQSILGAAKSLTRYFGVSTFIYRTFAAVKEGITNIVELDTALVDLRKTTDGTVEQLNGFYYSSNETAKSLGVTTKEVIQATAEWSRLGYSLKDAETMAEVSAKFKAISPGVEMEQAQDGLVSAMKAFNIEADEALDGIASKINAIGNSQAVSNADIIEFLTRSSSAMKEANNTLEETIALGTAA